MPFVIGQAQAFPAGYKGCARVLFTILAINTSACTAPAVPLAQIPQPPASDRITMSDNERADMVHGCIGASSSFGSVLNVSRYCTCQVVGLENYFTRADWRAMMLATSEPGVSQSVIYQRIPKAESVRQSCMAESVR